MFWYDPDFASCQVSPCNSGVGDGVIACLNGLVCSNWAIYNNDFINIQGYNSGICDNCYAQAGSGNASSFTIENNLWWNNGLQPDMNGCSNCTMNEAYNTYLNMRTPTTVGTGDVVINSGAPLTPSYRGWRRRPSSAWLSVDSDRDDWTTLNSPFNVDPYG